MFGKICPYCREKIKKNAVVCRYCHRDLKAEKSDDCSSLWIFAGFTGLALGAAAVLGLGYLNERKRWKEHDSACDFEKDATDQAG